VAKFLAEELGMNLFVSKPEAVVAQTKRAA
jgi:hypothetical protein